MEGDGSASADRGHVGDAVNGMSCLVGLSGTVTGLCGVPSAAMNPQTRRLAKVEGKVPEVIA